MSSQDVNPIGPRGETYDGTRHPTLLGLEREFDNMTDSTPTGTLRDARKVKMQYVLNGEASSPILPGMLVKYEATKFGKEVNIAPATIGTIINGVADHHLPAAGVAAGRGFWIVREGPCKFINDASATITEGLAVGVSPSVAGSVRATDLTPSSDADSMDQQVGRCGQMEADTLVSVAGYGYFKAHQ